MMAPGTTEHTSLLSESSYLFYQINCLTENIFPSNSSVRSNELWNFVPYTKFEAQPKINAASSAVKFNICVLSNRLANFHRSVLIVSTNCLLLHLYL